MITESLSKLIEKIERRRGRILTAPNWRIQGDTLRRFWSFVQSEPLLKSTLDKLQGDHSNQRQDAAQIGTAPTQTRTTDAEQAAFASFVLARCFQAEEIDYLPIRKLEDNVRNQVIDPLFDFLVEQLDDQQIVAGQLLAYKKRCEWFDRDDLAKKTTIQSSDKINEIEKRLQADLYRYLHDHGINFVITPYSVRGEIDLIADQQDSRKLYVEVKVCDNDGRGKPHIKEGFNGCNRSTP